MSKIVFTWLILGLTQYLSRNNKDKYIKSYLSYIYLFTVSSYSDEEQLDQNAYLQENRDLYKIHIKLTFSFFRKTLKHGRLFILNASDDICQKQKKHIIQVVGDNWRH